MPAALTGVATGAFNAGWQLGGSIGVAVFGALLRPGHAAGFMHGMRLSLVIAACVALGCAALPIVLARRPGRQP